MLWLLYPLGKSLQYTLVRRLDSRAGLVVVLGEKITAPARNETNGIIITKMEYFKVRF
jgi:hypothetical protein